MASVQTLTRLLCAFLIVIAVGSPGILFAQSNSTVVFLREQQLRERSKVEVLPKYPNDAVKIKASGVVVTQVDYDATGIITSFAILESADPRFNIPTIKALKQWRFNPVTTPEGVPLKGKGKLTFYFFWKNGRGWCENPLVFQRNRKAPGVKTRSSEGTRNHVVEK